MAETGGYGVNIFWSEEDDCYVATFPDFPNLSAFGDTWEEAAADARIVLGMALEYLSERGIAPPRPTLNPALETRRTERNFGQMRASARKETERGAASARP